MSASEVSCPTCATRLVLPPGNTATRFRCTRCTTVFDIATSPPPAPPPPAPTPVPVPVPVFVLPDTEPDADEPEPPPRSRPRRAEVDEPPRSRQSAKRGSGGKLALVVCVGSLVLVGAAVGGYFIFRDSPKTTAKADPTPATPPKPVPKATPLTPEQMIRKMKTSTVYIRSFHRGGDSASGSGFFAGKPGFVVTNAHVIGYGPTEVKAPVRVEIVVDSGGPTERAIPVTVFGVDVDLDLALLRADGTGLPVPLAFGKSEELVETQEVVAFGYPFGEMLGKNVSVNRTTVSSLRKTNGSMEKVQLAGGLNPGNSGGPVANARGEVIGVSVAKLRGTDTIAFAIPAETTDKFVDDQITRGGAIRLGALTDFALDELEGTYLLIGLEGKGINLTEDELRKLNKDERRVVIKGDQLITNLKGKEEAATIKLNGSKRPAHIDITPSRGGNVEPNYGIYKFENGVLTICATEKGTPKDRPKDFDANETSVTLILRKQPAK